MAALTVEVATAAPAEFNAKWRTFVGAAVIAVIAVAMTTTAILVADTVAKQSTISRTTSQHAARRYILGVLRWSASRCMGPRRSAYRAVLGKSNF
jgi:hypothetical protein